MARVWFEEWRDDRPIREGPVDWEVFKTYFFDRFFPIELRERKLVKFMNLHQDRMSVREYSVKFTQLSKYAPTLVANFRVCDGIAYLSGRRMSYVNAPS